MTVNAKIFARPLTSPCHVQNEVPVFLFFLATVIVTGVIFAADFIKCNMKKFSLNSQSHFFAISEVRSSIQDLLGFQCLRKTLRVDDRGGNSLKIIFSASYSRAGNTCSRGHWRSRAPGLRLFKSCVLAMDDLSAANERCPERSVGNPAPGDWPASLDRPPQYAAPAG